ncbi:MAG: endoglucanase [Bacteroidaceae bacterium]|nr:endoglucanase [Bacteroidaceae bacterium]
MKKSILLTFFTVACITAGAHLRIVGNNPNISYTGRTLAEKDGSVKFDWSGTYLQTDFTGGSIAIVISDTRNDYFNLFIDSKLIRKFQVSSPTPTTIQLAEGLSPGTHRLRLQKCTEGNQGCTTIHALLISEDGTLRPVARKPRLIECIGDSYTCGFGTESKNATDHFQAETENCNQAYGCIIAKYFNADYVLIAHSGRGMSRNYGDSVQLSKANMVDRYLQIFDDFSQEPYKFKAYRPDLVTINLGTNDYSPGTGPTPELYTSQYLKLIKQVRKHYGEVPILCIIPHSCGAPLKTSLDTLRNHIKNLNHVYMTEPMPGIVTPERDLGAAYHPNYQGQRKIAMTLIPRVAAIMGWELEEGIVE